MIDDGTVARSLILQGSARSNGNTAAAAHALKSRLGSKAATLVDLRTRKIRPFDYSDPQPDDDFSDLAELMLAHHSLIFATPVYWYAMSGLMKTFFDRLSDLLSDRDPARRGRSLAGRDVWLLAVGADPALPPGFEEPFSMTSRYLEMRWRGGFYVRTGDTPEIDGIDALVAAVRASVLHGS